MSWVTDAVRLFGFFDAGLRATNRAFCTTSFRPRMRWGNRVFILILAIGTARHATTMPASGWQRCWARRPTSVPALPYSIAASASATRLCFGSSGFEPATIDGLNISRSQVQKARERVRAAGLEERVRLHLGSATRMPFGDASFDRVMALESAFHFDTREAFFREAFRVLKPGGRLATADLLPMEGRSNRWWDAPTILARRPRTGILAAAMSKRLEDAGFTGVRAESVVTHSLRAIPEFTRGRLRAPDIRARMNPMVRWILSGLFRCSPPRIDYVIAAADEP